MAWTIVLDKFLWVADLKIGAWIYGGVMTALCIYYIFINNLGWGGWIFFLLAATPMMVTFVWMLVKMNDSKLWFYAWINWYFTFFAWILGSIQFVVQTVVLSVMITKAGKANLLYPESAEELFSKDPLMMQGYKALPDRFHEIVAFFHDDGDTDTYKEPKIYGERTRAQLGWLMFGMWLAYIFQLYFTLVNYSYWKKLQTEAIAAGTLDRTLA